MTAVGQSGGSSDQSRSGMVGRSVPDAIRGEETSADKETSAAEGGLALWRLLWPQTPLNEAVQHVRQQWQEGTEQVRWVLWFAVLMAAVPLGVFGGATMLLRWGVPKSALAAAAAVHILCWVLAACAMRLKQ
ncbi:hypothetical protein CDCA_CDCA17G4384 [Cyanidium caldarium]|uniref:Uncharacterized protein n=1 Tax=Cyanidium caldarium TaxID=2771 RepID=A0AAV9J1D3_CYACA|nr:hypothetical protein CDCA_CDCA17G4384 [Cyanidium caldarium]|eukprot:ctg_285.g196